MGRPRKADSGVSHLEREKLAPRYPVHVVMRLGEGLPRLRSKKPYQVLRRCFAKGSDRFGFRLNHDSVQGNHLHFIVEAKDRVALSKGMHGLNVRMARGLNRLWGRKGKVFADRYFARTLKTPREVKNALAYVLKNGVHHGQVVLRRVDIFTSGMGFDGWRRLEPREMDPGEPPGVAPARTWLQRTGWRKCGLLVPDVARAGTGVPSLLRGGQGRGEGFASSGATAGARLRRAGEPGRGAAAGPRRARVQAPRLEDPWLLFPTNLGVSSRGGTAPRLARGRVPLPEPRELPATETP